MSNEKPPRGGSTSNQSALQRYLAKQKKDRAPSVPSTKTAKSPAGDPLSIPRPGETERVRDEQPPDLRKWETTTATMTETIADEPAPATPVRQNAGEFGTRLLATLIDSAIVGAIGYPARLVVNSTLGILFGPIVNLHLDGLSYLTSALIIYAYYGFFYSTKGASPGKMLLNLEVVDSTTGNKLTPWKAFFREAIGKPISFIPFFMGYIIVLFRDDRKALHDLLFDTQVISKKP